MSVYLQKGGTTYLHDFWYKGQRYTGSTGQLRKEDAVLWESKLKLRLRQEIGGIAVFDRLRTPSFTAWAEGPYWTSVQHLPSAATIEQQLRVVLRFWGRRPKDPDKVDPQAPYHDLRLADPILDPSWLEKFERWMQARGIAGQTRNHYRSRCSALYRLIMKKPMYRQKYRIDRNPFLDLERDRKGGKLVALTVEELQQLIEHASYHVRLALAIGALAPELRKEQVLGLRWSKHLSSDLAWMRFNQHKTSGHTGKPMVVPIVEQLGLILMDAKTRVAGDHLITYQGKPVKDIRDGVRNAAEAAGLPYGRDREDGLTFHSLRHSTATLMAELDIQESKRMIAMGHLRLETTQQYTHLRPVGKRVTLEQASAAMPLAHLVRRPGQRAVRTSTGTGTGTREKQDAKSLAKQASAVQHLKGRIAG